VLDSSTAVRYKAKEYWAILGSLSHTQNLSEHCYALMNTYRVEFVMCTETDVHKHGKAPIMLLELELCRHTLGELTTNNFREFFSDASS
jgi:hypothetical protein